MAGTVGAVGEEGCRRNIVCTPAGRQARSQRRGVGGKIGFDAVKIEAKKKRTEWVALAHAACAGDGGAEAIRVLGADANVPIHRGDGEHVAVQAEGG